VPSALQNQTAVHCPEACVQKPQCAWYLHLWRAICQQHSSCQLRSAYTCDRKGVSTQVTCAGPSRAPFAHDMLSNNGATILTAKRLPLLSNMHQVLGLISLTHPTCAHGATPQQHVLRKGAAHNRCAGLHRQLLASCRICVAMYMHPGCTTRRTCYSTTFTGTPRAHPGALGPVLQRQCRQRTRKKLLTDALCASMQRPQAMALLVDKRHSGHDMHAKSQAATAHVLVYNRCSAASCNYMWVCTAQQACCGHTSLHMQSDDIQLW
jgi:hypothetical protein